MRLPQSGSFEERLAAVEAGPLGRMAPGSLVQIEGTRLLVYNATRQTTSPLSDRKHGTGVVGAAALRRSGSAPGAVYVLVLGHGGAWDWVAEQPWIDVATTSVNTAVGGGTGERGPVTDNTCSQGPGVRRAVDQGKLVLSAGGNGDPAWNFYAPSALPEVLRVGGHQPDGSPQALVTRPYEVSDLFSVDAPDPDTLTGTAVQVGTSFAAPHAAGRAAVLVDESRRLLVDMADRPGRALAAKGRQARLPRTGPMADGSLTNVELRTLLQDTATPQGQQRQSRYLTEGFGLLGDEQMKLSRRVLRGEEQAPDRSAEREQHERMQLVRSAATHSVRCG